MSRRRPIEEREPVVEEVVPVLGTGPLLLIALAAVGVLLVLIMKFKVHAFVALVLVSLLTALATGIGVGEVVSTLLTGFGSTLASVALLVGLGAMIGKLLEVTGAVVFLGLAIVAAVAPGVDAFLSSYGGEVRLDAMSVGMAAWRLGAGRSRKEDPVQAGAGVVWHARPGDEVTEGQPLFTLLTDEPARFDRALSSLEGGYDIGSSAGFTPGPIVLDRIS